MKKDLTEKENREICLACCVIFVFYLPKPKDYFGDKQTQEDICKLIADHNWEKLFKSKSWIESLTNVAINLPSEALLPTSDALKVLMKYFEEMYPILDEATRIRNFQSSAKRGDKFPYHKLPLHTQFCLPVDEYPGEPAGRYKNHFSKDSDTKAHCFIGTAKKIELDPQEIVVYIPVAGP